MLNSICVPIMYVYLPHIVGTINAFVHFTELTVSLVFAVSGPQHFSYSNAGSSSSNGGSQERSAGNGKHTVQEAMPPPPPPPSRKFSEGPLPVVSSSNEPAVGGVGGSGFPPPSKDDSSSRGMNSGEGEAPNKEGLMSMKPPSLPPPSKLKESSAMPPPPSLPSRFAKGRGTMHVCVLRFMS